MIPSDDPDFLTSDNLTDVATQAYHVAAPEPTTKRVSLEYKQARVLSKEFILHPLTLLYYINSPRTRPILLQNAQHHHLADWIASMAPFETTEPVDKVYGILGLFKPFLRAGDRNDISSLEVDYECPFGEAYTKVMKRVLLQGQNLAWLEAHAFSPEAENKRQLPSWVFDWKAPSFETIVTRHSQAYWAASSPHVSRQNRRIEISMDRDSFGTVEGDTPIHTRCTCTVPGTCYRQIDMVQPAEYETKDISFLSHAIFDLGWWRVATYSQSSTEMSKSGSESILSNFYVVPWAQPGDIIIGLSKCPNFFLLRPIAIGNKECFHYLGRAIAKIPKYKLDSSGQNFRKRYGQKQKFVLN